MAAPLALSQAAYTPPPDHALVGVKLGLADDAPTGTLVLRGGRVEAVLAAGEAPPPGVRVVDAAGLLALPAFVDAYTTAGVPEATPRVDLDEPLDTGRDVRADMQLANRKGLQPARAVVDEPALALTDERLGQYRAAGFGLALQAPDGELLGGSGVLVALRDAALRDRVVLARAWQHAAFAASGDGYPSTLMGFHAQLRQFFSDSAWHADRALRAAAGGAGPRPPYDAELEAGAELLAGGLVLARAQGGEEARRWVRLADELGIELGLRGLREAWAVAAELAERPRPVVLTLEWGEEPDDPRPGAEKKGEREDEPAEPAPDAAAEPPAAEPEPVPPESAPVPPEAVPAPTEPEPVPPAEAPAAEPAAPAAPPAAEAPAGQDDPHAARGEDEDEDDEGDEDEDDEDPAMARFVYTEPYAVRLERRTRWERDRDGALALQAAGVPFAIGTAGAAPGELLGRVRDLVEAGLPQAAALDALTAAPARFLGLAGRCGTLAPGADATLALWSANPFTDKKAEVKWLFVDGYPWEKPPEAAGTGRERRRGRGGDDDGHDHPHVEALR